MINVRQSDIARELNVSRITVSKALRNHPDISVGMKKKVTALAKKMGYVPNLIATQLNSRHSHTIGIVIPDLENSFFSYIVDSIIDYATDKNFRVILTVSRENETIEKRNIENLIGMRVDGLLVCNSQKSSGTAIYDQIRRMNIPLIFFDRMIPGLDFTSIVFDDKPGAISALDELINAGYRKIAHLAGYQGINIGKERMEGYKASLIKHNIPVRNEWIIEGGYELTDGQISFNKLFSQKHLPEVILAVNDRVALGAYFAANQSGLKIPDDIGIIAYGFSETADRFNPPLAIINQDPRNMGKTAAMNLINEIKMKSLNKISQIRIGENFIWNESVMKPRAFES
jgi:LacI family transcriptional regulator